VVYVSPCSSAHSPLVSFSLLNSPPPLNLFLRQDLTYLIDFGERQETNSEGIAWDQCIYTVSEVERITRVAAQIAKSTTPPMKVISIDKANVLATSRLWRKTVTELMKKEYPELEVEHQLVDSAAMIMVRNPRSLNGVVVTENMFGDM
jgi:3-isopropylmalate dehydrogenase